MILVDKDAIIPQLLDMKFANAEDVASLMFNMGIDKAIDTLNNAPEVDAKVKLSPKEYQHNYYERVTKVKRQEKRRQANEGNNTDR